MQHTKIEWAQNPDGTPGYTWNPITGCLNGCEYCYARKLANGRLKSRMLANYDIGKKGYSMIAGKPCTLAGMGHLFEKQFRDPFYPRFWASRMNQLDNPMNKSTWQRQPHGIFVCNMSDLFGIGIPEKWTHEILDAIRQLPDRFYLLTQQPQNLAKWSPFPDNCWVGVTATGGGMMGKAIACLSEIEARVKYLSIEPLLEEIHVGGFAQAIITEAGINWLILGSQTRPTIMPKIEWVEEIVKAADCTGIPVFLKDSLKPLLPQPLSIRFGSLDEGLRQEMPR